MKGNVVIAKGQGAIAAERLREIFTGKIIAAGGFEPTPPKPSSKAVQPMPSRSAGSSSPIRICRAASANTCR